MTVMDFEAVQGFLSQGDADAQTRALNYFEELKNSYTGWQLCIQTLLNPSPKEDSVKFFCFSVLEHYIKTRYENAEGTEQQLIRSLIIQWIQTQACSSVPEKAFVRNKAAYVFCQIFLVDYPERWSTFFRDLINTLSLGVPAVDCYLRILLAINSDVADREIARTPKEIERSTKIKDTVRDQHITEIVNSWYTIITTYHITCSDITCLCLEVIGAYVAWIDINLIANEQFMSILVNFLSQPTLQLAACDCIYEIINKGMEPSSKLKLVKSVFAVLEQTNILKISEDEDTDFCCKLAKLSNGIGIQLLACWSRLVKTGDASNLYIVKEELAQKIPFILQFLGNNDDNVSQEVTECIREYIQYLKHNTNTGAYGVTEKAVVENILHTVIKKYKFDDSYSFEHQGEDEALFLEYRKTLKVLFDNVAQLDKELTLSVTRSIITTTLQNWQNLPFQDVETVISFLYLLGEAVPTSFSNDGDQPSPMHVMLQLLITSNVNTYGHIAVTLQFFETIVRYEKFFNQEPQYIPDVLVSFLDQRGLRNVSPSVRSRVSYLFSRFVKCLKVHMQNFTEDILKCLQDLLVLSPPENGISLSLLSSDDQFFLYEAAAVLIISSQFSSQKKQLLLKNLLSPVMKKFSSLIVELQMEMTEEKRHLIAECMNHAISVTSRTSKAFSNQQTMKACNCVQIYLDALQVFLQALDLPYEQSILQSGVRQFLHRMVVCLEEEILPFIPRACEQLLKTPDMRSIQEFVPLINQIIGKFKLSWVFQKEVVPFLQQIFMPLVTAIFNALALPIDPSDQQAQRDKQMLQRSYFLFIASIVTNNVVEVIASQDMQNLEQVFSTIIQGAVEFPDPVAQKTCFSILRKMVELWGGADCEPRFLDFIYKSVVPACFLAPLKATFDLSDAQTILALSESALCLKTVLDKRGEEFVTYLQTQYLPTMNISPQQVQEYCANLRSEPKIFKNYLKLFFHQVKS